MTTKNTTEIVERIQKLQKDLHDIATTGMLTLAIIGSKGLETAILENTLETIHNVSHAIQDVLDGKTSEQAIKSNLASKDDEEGDE